MHRFLGALLALCATLSPAATFAQSNKVVLAWDANTEDDVVGYMLRFGTAPRSYTTNVNVGAKTRYEVQGLAPGTTYYFTVQAYSTDGAMSPPSVETTYTTANPWRVADGRTELIWRHQIGGQVARWQMRGLQQLSGDALGPGRVDDLNWQIAGAGDFNGDGERDLLWQHADGRISVWLMRDTTQLEGRALNPGRVDDTKWRIATVTDLDKDGKSDLIWQHQSTGEISAWLMDGTRMRQGRPLTPGIVEDLDWKIVGAGDFDGDHRNDLIWRHQASGAVAVWYMSGDRLLSGALLSPEKVDVKWRIAAIGDVNGDTRVDIVWQHANGQLSVWIMDGERMASGAGLSPGAVLDLGWRIVAGR